MGREVSQHALSTSGRCEELRMCEHARLCDQSTLFPVVRRGEKRVRGREAGSGAEKAEVQTTVVRGCSTEGCAMHTQVRGSESL